VDANIERLVGLGKLFDKTIYEPHVIDATKTREKHCAARLSANTPCLHIYKHQAY